MSETPQPVERKVLLAAVVLAAVTGVVVGALAAWFVYGRLGPSERAGTPVAVAAGGSTNIADLAAQRAPSLVSISIAPRATDAAGAPTYATGFVVSADGLVMTSAHAVSGATQLRVATADGHVYDATVAAADAEHGIAVLRLAGARDLVPLTLTDGTQRAGDLALVLGRTAAGPEVAVGTVRAMGQTARVDTVTLGGVTLVDAAIGAADDGAPVIDGNGGVAGVTVTGASQAGPVTVVPAGVAARVLAIATQGAAATRPSFGAVTEILDPAAAALAGLPPGALIIAVVPGSPAQTSGLQPGEVVTAVGGTPVDAGHPFEPTAFGLAAGGHATLSVSVRGTSQQVAITLAA